LRQIKQAFGRNADALRIEGDDTVLSNPQLVAKVERHSDEIEVLLAPNVGAQQLLHQLVAANVKISKFEMIEPSLNDIFIEKVSET
jgi:ABC-2 type transport system ATP-binding protein